MEYEPIEYSNIDYSKIPAYAKSMKSIFGTSGDINKNAYLNWRAGFGDSARVQFVTMGEAFFDTAYNLIQQCLENNADKKADSWIFPILFNIVHGTEVYLKAINVSLSELLGKTRVITDGGHDLKGLCSSARKLIIEYKTVNKNGTTEQMFNAIKLIQKFIDNIYKKTDDMTFARYPMDKNKSGHFYIQALDNEIIDMLTFREEMKYVYHMLNFIYEMPERLMENARKAEMG